MSTHTFKSNSLKSQEFSITASITQAQGNGTLTANTNEISTVANVDDTLTLPISVEGFEILIINNGENTLQIFPPSGDDLGNGTNASTELETNEEIKLLKLENTSWHIEDTTEIFHAEIHDEDNTTAYTISASSENHCYHSSSIITGDILGWTLTAGGTAPISSIAVSGSDILVTTSSVHDLAVGDIISQNNLTDSAYVGVFIVQTVPSTTTYTVTATFTATGTGTMNKATSLTCNNIASGAYAINYDLSAVSETSGDTFKFFIYKNATKIAGTKRKKTFSTEGDVSKGAMTHIDGGDKISLILRNNTTTGNITLEDYDLLLLKL